MWRAWSTSRTPGTGGFQARTVSSGSVARAANGDIAGSYKTAGGPPFYGPGMEWLAPLLAFGFACTVTPGPNNVLLWASGAAFGVRRTWPHVIGTALGVGLLGLLVAAGLGVVITTVPPLAFALKVGGSIYLLYLAWQVAGARALERAT